MNYAKDYWRHCDDVTFFTWIKNDQCYETATVPTTGKIYKTLEGFISCIKHYGYEIIEITHTKDVTVVTYQVKTESKD